MYCRGLHEVANPAFLSRFLCSGLLRVAPYCVPGGIRVVSTAPRSRPPQALASPWLASADVVWPAMLDQGRSPYDTTVCLTLYRDPQGPDRAADEHTHAELGEALHRAGGTSRSLKLATIDSRFRLV